MTNDRMTHEGLHHRRWKRTADAAAHRHELAAITERLNEIGYDVRLKAIVGDDVDDLARVMSAELARRSTC